MRTTSLCIPGSQYANFLAIPACLHTGIPICMLITVCAQLHYAYGDPHMQIFSNPRPFAHRDSRMHTEIPVCKVTHMGTQDLISHMEIFPVCIRLVTEISPYAYGDCANPRMHMGIKSNPCMHTGICASPYAYGDLRVPVCIRGLLLIPVCIRGLHVMQSPYAYRDFHAIPVCKRGFARPHMHAWIDLDPRMHTGITCHVIPMCIQGFSCNPRMHTGIA